MMTAWVVLVYGILVAVGGAMGYFRKGSTASLMAGVGSGIVLAIASWLMMKSSYQTGWWIALIIALLLLGRFGSVAVSKGFSLMPGGLVIILSVIVIAVLIMQRTPTIP